MFADKEWLDSLKAGDEVVIDGGMGGASLHVVSHATKTRVTAGGFAFRRSDGNRSVNGGYNHLSINPATPELRAKIEHLELSYRLGCVSWKKFSLEALREIKQIVDVEMARIEMQIP